MTLRTIPEHGLPPEGWVERRQPQHECSWCGNALALAHRSPLRTGPASVWLCPDCDLLHRRLHPAGSNRHDEGPTRR